MTNHVSVTANFPLKMGRESFIHNVCEEYKFKFHYLWNKAVKRSGGNIFGHVPHVVCGRLDVWPQWVKPASFYSLLEIPKGLTKSIASDELKYFLSFIFKITWFASENTWLVFFYELEAILTFYEFLELLLGSFSHNNLIYIDKPRLR